MTRLPLLTIVAAGAGLGELLVNRTILRSIGGNLEQETLVFFLRAGALLRNLAAIAGVVMLVASMVDFVRARDHVSLRRRLSAAATTGVLIPVLMIALLFPRERVTPQLVVLGAAAAYLLAASLAGSGLRATATLYARVAMALLAMASILSVFVLVVSYGELVARLPSIDGFMSAVRHLGEALYLGAALAATTLMVPRGKALHARVTQIASALLALVFSVGLAVGMATLGDDFATVFYGVQRLEWFLGGSIFVYALPLGASLAVAAAGALGPSPIQRQASLGGLLWLAAGNAPRSPGRLLMMVLGVMLLVRAAFVLGRSETGHESSGS